MRRLNDAGYGVAGSDLVLNLVYNPVAAFLPPPHSSTEAELKEQLFRQLGLVFNNLFVITNMPINRFRHFLERAELLDDYMGRLINALNPEAAKGVMCRTLLSVRYNGSIYDCDFNQMLGLRVNHGTANTVWVFDHAALVSRRIMFGDHCYSCTAGAGSSCGGSVVR